MKLTRRDFVKTGAALACAGAAVCESREKGLSMSTTANDKINILLIHADQHRIECMGAYGNPDIRTPHLDALAGESTRYENSFCPYPVCTPSRYSMLSGQYVHEHRGWTNYCTLAPEIPTFPRLLRDAGYATKAVGKMHFTPTYLDVGFEDMVLAEQDGPGRWDDDYHRALMAAGLVDVNDLEDQRQEYRRRARSEYWESFGAMPSNLPEEWHTTSWVGDCAATALDAWEGGGNLLMVGFVKPHHPFDPPASSYDAYDPDGLGLLPGWTEQCLPRDIAFHGGYFPHEKLNEQALRRVMACYYATIEDIDAQVGRMVALLKKRGLYDNTLIIYTSDHGEYMGFHHLLLKGNYLYDPLVKVPLLIKYPSHTGMTGERVSTALTNNIDLAPTILAQADIAPASSMRGLNLAASDEGHEMVFCELTRGRLAMARTRNRKLILAQDAAATVFFDLEKDPFEMENRADDPAYRDDIAALSQAIEAWSPRDEKPNIWLDENAPIINQPNVPPRDNSHRPEIIAWYEEQMKQFLS